MIAGQVGLDRLFLVQQHLLHPDQIGLLPGAGAAPVAGRALPADCDPWSLIEGAQAVHADMEDEWALIAGLIGVPVIGISARSIGTVR